MKLRIFLVGFGFMGRMHARVYQALAAGGTEVEIVAVVDPVPGADAEMAAMGIAAPRFATLAEALASREGEVVDICLPTDLHAGHIAAAARAGKHIFCEKPLALTVGEGTRAVAAAQEAGVFLQVGHCIRFWPEYVALREFAASGRGGALRRLSLTRRSSRPLYSQGDWLNDAARSKGAALDLHIHDTDFVVHLLGTPRAVSSRGRSEKGSLTHLSTHYHYDGVAVSAEGGWDLPAGWGFQMAFQAVFDGAAIDYDSLRSPTLSIVRDGKAPEPLPFSRPTNAAAAGVGGNISDLGGYHGELASFCRRIAAGLPPETATGPEALESLRVALAEIESAETGRPVTL